MDVLSVKMYAHDLLLTCLPESADIVCTHPMFGPESGRDSWAGLPFVYDLVRIAEGKQKRCDAFIECWKTEQCKMVRMTCEQHDSYAASTQFITHTTGTGLLRFLRFGGEVYAFMSVLTCILAFFVVL